MVVVPFLSLPVLSAQPAWSGGVPYEYDGSGYVIRMGTDAHRYDLAGRVVESATNGVQTKFTYDALGNRQTCMRASSDCQYGRTVDPVTNRIRDLSYDEVGNVLELDGRTFTYDALNMQTGEHVSNMLVTEYVYTVDDERIGVASPATRTWRWTVRDTSNKVLREFTSADPPSGTRGTASWKWAKDYVWRDGSLLATRQPDLETTGVSTYHYHLDHLGTPRLITSAANVVGRHDYHAFGVETEASIHEPSATAIKYTGHERDGDLDYMHARFYSAKMGRFLSVDPVLDVENALTNPQQWNRYIYVRDNPMTMIDPAGAYACEGSLGDCQAFATALAANLESSSTTVSTAAASYGTLNDGNGITVKFRTSGNGGSAHLDDVSWDMGTNQATIVATVELNTADNDADGFQAAVAHEGSHLMTYKNAALQYFASGGTAPIPNNRTSEFDAYAVTAAVATDLGHPLAVSGITFNPNMSSSLLRDRTLQVLNKLYTNTYLDDLVLKWK